MLVNKSNKSKDNKKHNIKNKDNIICIYKEEDNKSKKEFVFY